MQRSWWSTAASAAFFLFTVTVALPQCVRQRGMSMIPFVTYSSLYDIKYSIKYNLK